MKNKIRNESEFEKWFEKNFRRLGYVKILKKNKYKFPDYIMMRNNEKIRVELELRSSNFILHKHPIEQVDEVVCIEKDNSLPKKIIKVGGLTYEPKKVKRVNIALDDTQIGILKSIKGFGTKEAEKVKNILMAYLSEKGYLKEFQKR